MFCWKQSNKNTGISHSHVNAVIYNGEINVMCFDLMNDAMKTWRRKKAPAISLSHPQIEFIILFFFPYFRSPHRMCCEWKNYRRDMILFIRFALIIVLSPCSESLFNCFQSFCWSFSHFRVPHSALLRDKKSFLLCVGVFYRLTLQWSCAWGNGKEQREDWIPLSPHFLLFIAIFYNLSAS